MNVSTLSGFTESKHLALNKTVAFVLSSAQDLAQVASTKSTKFKLLEFRCQQHLSFKLSTTEEKALRRYLVEGINTKKKDAKKVCIAIC